MSSSRGSQICKLIIPLMAALLLHTAQNSPASSQDYRYRSRSGPAISPLMEFFRLPSGVPGVEDNYHSFVRPRAQVNQTLSLQNRAIQSQRRQVGRLNTEVRELGTVNIAPTGSGGRFQYYSHYYNGLGRRR